MLHTPEKWQKTDSFFLFNVINMLRWHILWISQIKIKDRQKIKFRQLFQYFNQLKCLRVMCVNLTVFTKEKLMSKI